MSINFDNDELKVKSASVAQTRTTEVSSAPSKKGHIWAKKPEYYNPTAKPDVQSQKQHKFDPETVKTVQQNIASMLGSDDIAQGTKAVMARYYAKHDPEFSKLSPKEQERYINSKLAEFAQLLIPKGVKTEEQKRAVLVKTASLYTMAEVGKTPIEDIKNAGTDRVNSMLKEMEGKQFKALAEKIDQNDPLKSIEDFLKSALGSDERYAKLSDAQKDKFIKEKVNSFVKNTIGYDISGLPENTKKDIAKGVLTVVKALAAEGKGVSDFMAMSPLGQSQLIVNSLENNPELMKDEGVVKLVKHAHTRIKLMQNAVKSGKKEEDLTERDLYNELKKMDVKKMTPEQKELYGTYRSYEKLPPAQRDRLLNDKPNIKSNTIQRLLTNTSHTEFIKSKLPAPYQNKDSLLNDKEARDAYVNTILMSEDSAKAIEDYNAYLRSIGMSREEVKQFNKKIYAEHPELIPHQANMKMLDLDKTPENQARWDNIAANSGSDDMIALFRPLVKLTAESYNQAETVKYYEAQESTTFYHDISIAVNEKPKEFGLEVEQKLAVSNVLTDEKKTVATKELIITADASRQEYYAREFSKIANKAVTEGLIQAEPYIKPEAQTNYSKYVENAINNNGYDAQTKAQLNQTRAQVQNSSINSEQNSAPKTSNNTSYHNNQNVSYNEATTSPVVPNSTPVQNNIQTPSVSSKSSQPQVRENIVPEIEKALMENKRDVVAAKIEEFQQHVAQSQQERAEKIEEQNKKEIEEQNKKVPEEVVNEFLEEYKDSGSITEDVKQYLTSVYSADGMTGLYEKIGSSGLGAGVQRQFLIHFASKGTSSAIRSFANSYKGNNSIIMLLYQYSNDSSLISYLSSDSLMSLLSQGKIKLKDFLKYASASTIANYMNELNKTGNNDKLKEILGLMNTANQDDFASRYSLNDNPRGGDAWHDALISGQKSGIYDDGIAMGSTKVPMGRLSKKYKQNGPFYFNA